MFTAIVEELGKVKSITRGSRSVRLSIECSNVLEGTRIGDSIAVNGICLTVTELGGDWFIADVMPETMRKTSLDKLNIKDIVNLERALRLSDRLGGHIVSGHIDGVGTIVQKIREDNAIWLTIEPPPEIQKYIIFKGSVAIDGISLTVADTTEDAFKISLIPHTAGATTLGIKGVGHIVNIECDAIGKYVEKLLDLRERDRQRNEGITFEYLQEKGF